MARSLRAGKPPWKIKQTTSTNAVESVPPCSGKHEPEAICAELGTNDHDSFIWAVFKTLRHFILYWLSTIIRIPIVDDDHLIHNMIGENDLV